MLDTDIHKNVDITLPLSSELYVKLEDFAKREGTTNIQLALQAVERYLEDLEDIKNAETVLEGINHGIINIISLEEMERRLGLDN
jgi:predicted DNA-binding protein